MALNNLFSIGGSLVDGGYKLTRVTTIVGIEGQTNQDYLANWHGLIETASSFVQPDATPEQAASDIFRRSVNIGRINASMHDAGNTAMALNSYGDFANKVVHSLSDHMPKAIRNLLERGVSLYRAPVKVDFFPFQVPEGHFVIGRQRTGFPHVISFSGDGLFVTQVMPDTGLTVRPISCAGTFDFGSYDYYVVCYDLNLLNCTYSPALFPDIFLATGLFSPTLLVKKLISAIKFS